MKMKIEMAELADVLAWLNAETKTVFTDHDGNVHGSATEAAHANFVHAFVAEGWPEHVAERLLEEYTTVQEMLTDLGDYYEKAQQVDYELDRQAAAVEAANEMRLLQDELLQEIACADPDIYPVEEWSEEAREDVAATRAEYAENAARWIQEADKRRRFDMALRVEGNHADEVEEAEDGAIARQRRITENARHDYHED